MMMKTEQIVVAVAAVALIYFIMQQYKPAKKEACCGMNKMY